MHRSHVGGRGLVGVWSGWGMELNVFRLWISNFGAWNLAKIARIFLQISASEKYFSDSGKWPFHTLPIRTPTKCRPGNVPLWFVPLCFAFAFQFGTLRTRGMVTKGNDNCLPLGMRARCCFMISCPLRTATMLSCKCCPYSYTPRTRGG